MDHIRKLFLKSVSLKKKTNKLFGAVDKAKIIIHSNKSNLGQSANKPAMAKPYDDIMPNDIKHKRLSLVKCNKKSRTREKGKSSAVILDFCFELRSHFSELL